MEEQFAVKFACLLFTCSRYLIGSDAAKWKRGKRKFATCKLKQQEEKVLQHLYRTFGNYSYKKLTSYFYEKREHEAATGESLDKLTSFQTQTKPLIRKIFCEVPTVSVRRHVRNIARAVFSGKKVPPDRV